jgi:hypothetical protein
MMTPNVIPPTKGPNLAPLRSNMDGAHKRTLEKALAIVVKKERLAAVLDVPMRDLDDYLSGEKPLPQQVFLIALDIVATRRQE